MILRQSIRNAYVCINIFKHIFVGINYISKQWWAWLYLKNRKANKSKSFDDVAMYYMKKVLQPSATDNPKTIIDENVRHFFFFF